MKGADSRTLMLALRAWLNEDERNARRIVELIYAKALPGPFASCGSCLTWSMARSGRPPKRR